MKRVAAAWLTLFSCLGLSPAHASEKLVLYREAPAYAAVVDTIGADLGQLRESRIRYPTLTLCFCV